MHSSGCFELDGKFSLDEVFRDLLDRVKKNKMRKKRLVRRLDEKATLQKKGVRFDELVEHATL